jgi:hypothetical protein
MDQNFNFNLYILLLLTFERLFLADLRVLGQPLKVVAIQKRLENYIRLTAMEAIASSIAPPQPLLNTIPKILNKKHCFFLVSFVYFIIVIKLEKTNHLT